MNIPCSLSMILTALLAVGVNAQTTFTMSDGSGSGCQGVLYDSGGQGATGYQDDENLTFTLCPDVPGNVIYLTFFTFNLDQSGPPNTWDNLTIYDGDNISATVLGSYTGNALQNLIVSGTVFNSTGCLTLVFHSNSNGTGVFAAGFQCTSPCTHPIPSAVMSPPNPAHLCQGDTVAFDGSASFSAAGIAQYRWDFADGSVDSTSGPLVSHVFAGPGAHLVQLQITDSVGCRNLEHVDLVVLVSTTPDLQLTTNGDMFCPDRPIMMSAVAVPTAWADTLQIAYGEPIALPDDVGQPFRSTLTLTQFAPGQTINSASDIEAVCMDMEHSYMGDLVIQVICPNGQTMIMHQQGGGGTYIGGANDNDALVPEPGTCWHYCWSPGATNGTFVDNSIAGITPHTTLTGTPPSQALDPGTYEAVESFGLLTGCPLNGDWSVQATDLWGADNGFICTWEIAFAPSIIPVEYGFTPSIGAGADSSYWSTSVIPFQLSTDGDTVTCTAGALGDQTFTYHVVDNFGCAYDTSVTVQVLEATDPYCQTLGIRPGGMVRPWLHPQPATDLILIDMDDVLAEYSLMDMAGRTVQRGSMLGSAGSWWIPVGALAEGTYILHLSTAHRTLFERVVKR